LVATKRVVVVGAGLSGLTCAYRLARDGVDTVVLEARDRVGGRAWRVPLDGGLEFDAGCEAADEAHQALLELAAELAVATRLAEPWVDALAPDLDEGDLAVFNGFQGEIDALAERIDPLHPEALDGAGALDAQTLGGRLEELGASPGLLATAEAWYSVAASTVPIGEMSLFAYAAKLAAGAAPNGLRVRFAGGPTALAERMAGLLGAQVRTGAQVVALESETSGVRVLLADGEVERGSRCVVAVPLTVQRSLRFDPELPPHRLEALARARYGNVVKAALAYAAAPPGPYPIVRQSGILYRLDHAPKLVVFFAGSGPGRELTALPDERRRARIAELAGGDPSAVCAVAWSQEPFTLGSYLIFGPGELTAWGRRLPEPHDRIHFAGAEASPLPSYMNGAVIAGERAAREVVAALV
jgi:monoamine oxidase